MIRQLLSSRNYAFLVSGQTISQIGNAFYPLAIYWLTYSLTHSQAALGYLATAISLTSLAGMFAGVLVDRWDRRRTMIWVDVARMAMTGALALLVFWNDVSLVLIIAYALVLGLLASLFSPAQVSLLPNVVRPDELSAAIGLNQGSSAGAGLIGTSLGGMLLGLFGAWALMLLDAASFLVSFVSVALVRLPRSATQPHQPDHVAHHGVASPRYVDELRAGLAYLGRRPFFRRLIPVSMILNFAFMPLNVLDVVWVRRVLHLGAFFYGLFGAFMVVGVILGSLSIGAVQRRFTHRQILVGALACLALGYMAFSRLPYLVPDLVILLVLGLVMGVVNPVVQALFQRAVPQEFMGRATGALSSLVLSVAPLGALLAGLAAETVPLNLVFLAGGLLMLATVPLALRLPTETAGDGTTPVMT